MQFAMKGLRGLARAFALGLCLLATYVTAAAESAAATERLQVADPYIELRTGPGRGYPVFYVAEKRAWVEVLLRHTDWYKVRAEGGQEGWVQRVQLQATLTEAGVPKSFRDLLLDDYLRRRVELGANWGRFKGEPLLKLWGAWRFSDTLSLEAAASQVQGVYSGTSLWHAGLNLEPWSDRRLSPYLGIGFGQFRNVPNASLVGALNTDAKLAHAGAGLRWHLNERFVLRADYTLYTAFVTDQRSTEYRALSAGLSFFF